MLGRFHVLYKPLRDALARRLRVPSIPSCLEQLRAKGLHPRHIIDVGAYRGDFARDCLRVWPEARITCFEPQPHMQAALGALAGQYPGQMAVYDCLLGAAAQDAVSLYQAETASSVLAEHVATHPSLARPMRTLDGLREALAFGACDLLKLDVQGYELEVLKGAQETLGPVQAIVAEINLLDIHKDVPLLPEVVGWLDQRGFVPYDLCGLTRRPLDGALWQVDMTFVPRESGLRRDKRWGADA